MKLDRRDFSRVLDAAILVWVPIVLLNASLLESRSGKILVSLICILMVNGVLRRTERRK